MMRSLSTLLFLSCLLFAGLPARADGDAAPAHASKHKSKQAAKDTAEKSDEQASDSATNDASDSTPEGKAENGGNNGSSPDHRILSLRYDPNDIYSIYTRVGYETYIQFAPREEVQTISIGEHSFWQLVPAGNRLFIRPAKNDVSTNMTVITTKHAYQFDLKSVADPDKKIVYVARFTYPDEDKGIAARIARIVNPFMPQDSTSATAAAAPVAPVILSHEPPPPPFAPPPPPPPGAGAPPPQPFAPPPAPLAVQESEASAPVALAPAPAAPLSPPPAAVPMRAAPIPAPEARNYQYTYSGPENIEPYEVFDSGGTTYFRFQPPLATPPSVATVGPDGTETGVTVYQNGSYFAVDTVSGKLALHSDAGDATLYNETLAH